MKKEWIKVNSKKGQLTIFVIVAIIIVFIIAGFLLLNKNSDIPSLKENPSGYIKASVDKCTKEAIEEAEKVIIKNAGFIEQDNPWIFNLTSYELLCDSSGKNNLCTNNHPMLIVETQNQIKEYIAPKINACFETIKSSLRNYKYQSESNEINVMIVDKEIRTEIKKDLVIEVNEQKVNIESFNVKISSPLYKFIYLTNRIINQELDCNCGEESCNADLVNLMRYNREFEIIKPVYGMNGEEVFTITEINSGKQFVFAIRNCAY
ncbi:hypothetical protein FJZ17_04250 [Candidatus Pacearchaeota archaeon]|nr:hypothetical protein [Candidatus Pacearchaeota archaeon]